MQTTDAVAPLTTLINSEMRRPACDERHKFLNFYLAFLKNSDEVLDFCLKSWVKCFKKKKKGGSILPRSLI